MTIKRVVACVLGVALVVGAYVYGKRANTVEVYDVPAITTETVQATLSTNDEDTKRAVKQITYRANETAPDYTTYTTSVEKADTWAGEIATQTHADKVISTKATTTLENGANVVDAKYYGVNLERKHEVQVEALTNGTDTYAGVSYRNRDVTLHLDKNLHSSEVMVGVGYTVARW